MAMSLASKLNDGSVGAFLHTRTHGGSYSTPDALRVARRGVSISRSLSRRQEFWVETRREVRVCHANHFGCPMKSLSCCQFLVSVCSECVRTQHLKVHAQQVLAEIAAWDQCKLPVDLIVHVHQRTQRPTDESDAVELEMLPPRSARRSALCAAKFTVRARFSWICSTVEARS